MESLEHLDHLLQDIILPTTLFPLKKYLVVNGPDALNSPFLLLTIFSSTLEIEEISDLFI